MIGPLYSGKTVQSRLVLSCAEKDTYYPPGSAPSYSFSTKYQGLVSESFQKFVYRQKRTPLGYVWPLPYDANGRRYTGSPLTVDIRHQRKVINQYPEPGKWRYSLRDYTFVGHLIGHDVAPIPILPERDPEGLLINTARLRAGEMKANVLVTLAELSKTCGMIRSRTKKIADVIDLVRKRNFVGAARLLGLKHPPARVRDGRAWADNFLEYQYGWLPLIADTVGYAQYLADFLRENSVVLGKASVKTSKLLSKSTKSIPIGPLFPGFSATVVSETTQEDIHEVVLSFRLKSYLFRELNQLGALQVPSAGWELTKLSFVWDWVFKVGDLLGSMDALVGLEFHSGSYTRFRRVRTTNRVVSVLTPRPSGDQIVFTNFTFAGGKSDGYIMRREVYEDLPPPAFVVEIPFTSNRDFRRALVSCALLRQRLSIPSTHFR